MERFTFDPEEMSLRRGYSVTDPVYPAAPYESHDIPASLGRVVSETTS